MISRNTFEFGQGVRISDSLSIYDLFKDDGLTVGDLVSFLSKFENQTKISLGNSYGDTSDFMCANLISEHGKPNLVELVGDFEGNN